MPRPRKNPLPPARTLVEKPAQTVRQDVVMPWDRAGADDIVADILRRISDHVSDREAIVRVDREVREAWGGDRPYIARRIGDGRSERNAAIRRDFASGERMGLLSRRYGLTERQILNIVHQTAGNPLP